MSIIVIVCDDRALTIKTDFPMIIMLSCRLYCRRTPPSSSDCRRRIPRWVRSRKAARSLVRRSPTRPERWHPRPWGRARAPTARSLPGLQRRSLLSVLQLRSLPVSQAHRSLLAPQRRSLPAPQDRLEGPQAQRHRSWRHRRQPSLLPAQNSSHQLWRQQPRMTEARAGLLPQWQTRLERVRLSRGRVLLRQGLLTQKTHKKAAPASSLRPPLPPSPAPASLPGPPLSPCSRHLARVSAPSGAGPGHLRRSFFWVPTP